MVVCAIEIGSRLFLNLREWLEKMVCFGVDSRCWYSLLYGIDSAISLRLIKNSRLSFCFALWQSSDHKPSAYWRCGQKMIRPRFVSPGGLHVWLI